MWLWSLDRSFGNNGEAAGDTPTPSRFPSGEIAPRPHMPTDDDSFTSSACHRKWLTRFNCGQPTWPSNRRGEISPQSCSFQPRGLLLGSTSSGKTSLLNVLLSSVAPGERIVTLEDTAELRLDAAHVLRLETRSETVDGTPAVTLADLVRTSLRLRPDRLVVGEVRGAEVVDMLQALNTGHDGSFTTCHANGPDDALRRVQSLVVQHTSGWPMDAVVDHVHASLDVVVHVARSVDGARRVDRIVEIARPGRSQHRVLAAGDELLAPLLRYRT
jgi:hypothetical protein